MKRFLILCAVALSLSGCAGTKVGDLLQAATTTIANPIGVNDIYRVKNAYAAALELAVEYRRYCWERPYAALMADPVSKPVCQNRRAVVRFAQSSSLKARRAIRSAETFVANNPTLNAATAIDAAWRAVTEFQRAVPLK